jgi:hypothetical protein
VVIGEQLLKLGIAQELHRAGEIVAKRCWQAGSEFPHVAVGNPLCKLIAGVAAHVLLDPTQPLHKHAQVVVALDVLPNVLDELRDGERVAPRLLDLEIRYVAEVAEQCAVEAIEDDELGFVSG